MMAPAEWVLWCSGSLEESGVAMEDALWVIAVLLLGGGLVCQLSAAVVRYRARRALFRDAVAKTNERYGEVLKRLDDGIPRCPGTDTGRHLLMFHGDDSTIKIGDPVPLWTCALCGHREVMY